MISENFYRGFSRYKNIGTILKLVIVFLNIVGTILNLYISHTMGLIGENIVKKAEPGFGFIT